MEEAVLLSLSVKSHQIVGAILAVAFFLNYPAMGEIKTQCRTVFRHAFQCQGKGEFLRNLLQQGAAHAGGSGTWKQIVDKAVRLPYGAKARWNPIKFCNENPLAFCSALKVLKGEGIPIHPGEFLLLDLVK